MADFPRELNLGDDYTIDLVEKEGKHRQINPSKVRMEIRYGADDSIFKLERVFVDYLKTPLNIRLTQELIDRTVDTSQILEFPDYICQEIINELVHLIMENSGDPRLQTHIPITNTIANPAATQANAQAGQVLGL